MEVDAGGGIVMISVIPGVGSSVKVSLDRSPTDKVVTSEVTAPGGIETAIKPGIVVDGMNVKVSGI